MKTAIIFFTIYFLLNLVNLFAQDSSKVKKNNEIKGKKHHQMNFVDKNGDGYNDNAPDHDGDGIPNGLDPDFIKMKKRREGKSMEYVDSDGDGINDNLQFNGKRRRMMNKNHSNRITPQNGNMGSGMGTGMGNGTNHGQKGKKGRK